MVMRVVLVLKNMFIGAGRHFILRDDDDKLLI